MRHGFSWGSADGYFCVLFLVFAASVAGHALHSTTALVGNLVNVITHFLLDFSYFTWVNKEICLISLCHGYSLRLYTLVIFKLFFESFFMFGMRQWKSYWGNDCGRTCKYQVIYIYKLWVQPPYSVWLWCNLIKGNWSGFNGDLCFYLSSFFFVVHMDSRFSCGWDKKVS